MTNLMGKIAASFANTLSGKSLDEVMTELAWARQLLHDAKAAKVGVGYAIAVEFASELAEVNGKLELAQAKVEEAERVARERALVEFKAGQGRKPHQNVQIKQYTTLEYDEGEALKYSREHVPSAVKLDKRAFEKVAKVVQLEFVEISNEDRVTISRDLSPLLAE